MAQIDFAEALLFTDRSRSSLGLSPESSIRVIPIAKIESAEAYSRFMLEQLVGHIATSHCLIVQWDGHVTDAQRWRDEFLEYDYIGASWPQFVDGHDVGNGGFSLRSRRLLEACQDPAFVGHHPEDVAICRTNRGVLEDKGINFAQSAIANQFSAERASDPKQTFGYHGAFLMPQVLDVDVFWAVYENLSDRATIWADFAPLLAALIRGRAGVSRASRLILHRLKHSSGG